MNSRPAPRDHVAIALQFEDDVLSGRMVVGRLMRAAVERQRRDCARSSTMPFEFLPELGAKICRFLELLPHVEGPEDLVGTRVVLEPWQVWAVVVMYGWVNRVTGYPRFRRSTLFMPKGQGKTFLAAGLALVALLLGDSGQKVLSAATTRKQAGLSFRTARRMLMRLPELCRRKGVEIGKYAISRPDIGASFEPISKQADSVEGEIPAFIIEDEIHAHKTRDLHDNLRSMSAKRPDSRMVTISTAGFDTSELAIGYEVYCYARDILLGSVQDDSQFCLLIQADIGDDPFSPATHAKANPNLGVSIDPVEVQNESNEASQRPKKLPSFLTKRLGFWVNSAGKWIAPAAWDKCYDKELKRERFDGKKAFIGVDLALTRDITARVLVFVEIGDDGRRHYYVFCDAYLAEESETLGEGNDSLRVWAEQGWLTLTPGSTFQISIMKEAVINDNGQWPGSEVCYDPFGAAALEQELTPQGIACVKIRQGAMTQSEPMKELEAAITDGRVHHDGNPVLAWCLCNIVTKEDANGNIRPLRETASKKIDAGVALINAFVRAYIGESTASIYETRDMVVV